jgi:hypothetical protein
MQFSHDKFSEGAVEVRYVRDIELNDGVLEDLEAAYDRVPVRDGAALTHSGWVFRVGPFGRPVGRVAVYPVLDRVRVGVSGSVGEAEVATVLSEMPSLVMAELMYR